MRTRNLTLDICDYSNNVLCNIYDNKSDISGQATDVIVSFERNGWKELTFKLPSTCSSDEGEERNYRLDYLIADYRIRLVDDNETDWFLISEPKITHNAFSQNIEVKAGHVCQLLRTKNLDLEFSDEEGNNVGTAEELLTTILDGTDWEPGEVYSFVEKNGDIKKRSMNSPAKSGCFKMIEDLCDLFEAKAVYHGDSKTVDIVPMNPFSKTAEGEIPDVVRNGHNVLELHYNKNTFNVSRTDNTENIITKLYAYGAYGDANLGMCSIQTCKHKEYIISNFSGIPAGEEVTFTVDGNRYFFITTDNLLATTELVWSLLDFTSRTYVWNEQTHKAYQVYKTQKTDYPWFRNTVTEVEKQNYFPFLFNFNYYDKIGLFTDEMLQEVAEYQRMQPAMYQDSIEAATAFNDELTELSEIAESNTGFLKLDISKFYETDNTDTEHLGLLRLAIDKTTYPTGVIYRSDYLESRKNYFQWYVASQLKPNGLPVSGLGSILFIVHPTTPATYDKYYLKSIWNGDGEVYLNSDNNPGTFNYKEHNDDPAKITLWAQASDLTWTDGDRYYLFCTDSMSGMLGEKTSEVETLINSIGESTKEATKEGTINHTVTFVAENEPDPSPSIAQVNYGWYYRYHTSDIHEGELYLCWGEKNELDWHRVYVQNETPTVVNGAYYLGRKSGKFYHGENNEWVLLDTEKEKNCAKGTAVVYQKALNRDILYNGLYEKYTYVSSNGLAAGNYAFENEFDSFYLFTTYHPVASEGSLILDTIKGQVWPDNDVNHISTYATRQYDNLTFMKDNEIIPSQYVHGNINQSGVYVNDDTSYVSNYIDAYENTLYEYLHPTGYAYFYNVNKKFLSLASISSSYYNESTDIRITNGIVDNNGELISINPNVYHFTGVISEFIELVPNKEYTFKATKITGGCPITISFWTQEFNYDPSRASSYFDHIITLSETGSLNQIITATSTAKYILISYAKEYVSNISLTSSESSGTFIAPENTRYIRFTCSELPTSSHYVRVSDYQNKMYIGNKMYTLLPNTGSGRLNGINNLVKEYADIADAAYTESLSSLMQAQEDIKESNRSLALTLGDLLRENMWQDDKYVEGDEEKLYTDAMDNLEEIAQPEYTYDFTFLDLYGANKDQGFAVDENEPEWPDVNITDAAHLVDPDIDTNRWAYLDRLDKCYDQEWNTKVKINTKLSLIGQHSFTDLLTRIAEVASQTKGKQSIYARAAALTTAGYLSSEKLSGNLQVARNAILGGASSWYTDDRGRIIFESTDGTSAMMLSGSGLLISSSRDEYGDWMWTSALTGSGLSTDQVATAFLYAREALIGSITTDMINAAVGNELEIGSNKALLLYATEDGQRPAGSLRTTDSLIEIAAGDGQTPAHIDILSGGEINIKAGTQNTPGGILNIESYGELNLKSGSDLTVESGADLYIASGGSINIQASQNGKFIVNSPNFSVTADGTVNLTGGIHSTWGEIAGFTIGEHKTNNVVDYRYLYSGTDGLTSTTAGVYIGTNGVNIGGGKLVYDLSQGKLTLDANNVYVGNSSLNTMFANVTSVYRDTSTDILLEEYHVGDLWVNTDNGYNNQYICTTVSNPRALSDWTLTGSALVNGAYLNINTVTGTINLGAANTVTVSSGGSITVAASNEVGIYTLGTIKIGKSTKPFTIGANNTDSYIYNGISSLTPQSNGTDVPFGTAVTGIYLGTDGINVGNTVKIEATGNAYFSGQIDALTGSIGGINISTTGIHTGTKNSSTSTEAGFYIDSGGAIYIGAYDSTAQSCPFEVTSAGALSATSATISGTLTAGAGSHVGGWYVGSNYIGNANTKNIATVGMAHLGTSDSDGIVFWAGGFYNGTGVNAPLFNVTRNGVLNASSANIEGVLTAGAGSSIGGWYVGDYYLGNQNTLDASTIGLGYNSGWQDTDYVFWAGGRHDGGVVNVEDTPTIPNFAVTKAGKLYATGAEISGNSTFHGTLDGADGTFTGTMSAACINSGTLSANYISGGTLTLGAQGGDNNTNGILIVKNASGSNVVTLNKTGITAIQGTLGGWTIDDDEIYSGYTPGGANTTCVCLDSNPSSTYAIYAGGGSGSSAQFSVKRNGDVTIKGSLTVTDENGTGTVTLSSTTGLWKLWYHTIKTVAQDGSSMTLSDGTTVNFNNAASLVIGWSGNKPSIYKNGTLIKEGSAVNVGTMTTSSGAVIYAYTTDSTGNNSHASTAINLTFSSDTYTSGTKIKVNGTEVSGFSLASYWNAAVGTVGLAISGTNKIVPSTASTAQSQYYITLDWGSINNNGERLVQAKAGSTVMDYHTFNDYYQGWMACYPTDLSHISGNSYSVSLSNGKSYTLTILD